MRRAIHSLMALIYRVAFIDLILPSNWLFCMLEILSEYDICYPSVLIYVLTLYIHLS